MSLDINTFKSKLTGGGARANLFKVICNFPGFAAGDVEFTSFMIKGAPLPSSVIAPIPIPWRGRQLQVPGDRTFEPWTLTVINDTEMIVRNAFERWMNGINRHSSNTGLTDPVEYTADMIVEQLNRSGDSTKRYDLRGTWPSNISTIELSNDAENTIEEFTVELQVTYWESNSTS